MVNWHQFYHPLTAYVRPLLAETRPCPPLRPYIRCFWGNSPTAQPEPAVWVVPDTCVDLIFRIDRRAGRVDVCFCGLDDRPYRSAGGGRHTLFAIRWYAWTAALFAQDSLRDTRDGRFAGEHHFPVLTKALAPRLLEVTGYAARVRLAEGILLRQFAVAEQPLPAAVQTAVGMLLQARGNLRTAELLHTTFCSARQLERLFSSRLGCSPKTLAGLIRYQSLWRDLLTDPHWNVQDAVAAYGFTDQSHLLRSFRHYHGMTPAQALVMARQTDSVAFLQSKHGSDPV